MFLFPAWLPCLASPTMLLPTRKSARGSRFPPVIHPPLGPQGSPRVGDRQGSDAAQRSAVLWCPGLVARSRFVLGGQRVEVLWVVGLPLVIPSSPVQPTRVCPVPVYGSGA